MAKRTNKKSAKKKPANKQSGKKSKRQDSNFAVIGQYLVAKNKKTKYIKLEASPKADKAVKLLVKKLIAALGTDIMFVNLVSDDARDKYEIPDFVKGRISVDMDAEDDSDEDDEDSEEDDDSEDEDEDDDSDNEDEDDEDDDDDDEDDSDF